MKLQCFSFIPIKFKQQVQQQQNQMRQTMSGYISPNPSLGSPQPIMSPNANPMQQQQQQHQQRAQQVMVDMIF